MIRVRMLIASERAVIRPLARIVLVCGICTPQWAQQSGLRPLATSGTSCASITLDGFWEHVQRPSESSFIKLVFPGQTSHAVSHAANGADTAHIWAYPGFVVAIGTPSVYSNAHLPTDLKNLIHDLDNSELGIFGYSSQNQESGDIFTASESGSSSKLAWPDRRARSNASSLSTCTSGVGQDAQQIAPGDFNGDGIQDDVYLTSQGIVTELRASDGSIASTKTSPLGFVPLFFTGEDSRIAVGDFNRDGKLDVAVSYWGTPGTGVGGAVYLLLGNGDGTFGTSRPFNAGSNPVSLAAADFNGDGKIDLAAANVTAGTISVLAGNGDGTFGSPASYSLGEDQAGVPESMVSLDLNNDGFPDLAVSNGPDNSISVLLNSGGKFGQPLVTALPVQADYLSYSDFNLDGKLDLLAVGTGASAIVILPGNGNGTFQAPATYAVAARPTSTTLVPLSDGNTIVVTNDTLTMQVLMTVISPDGTVNAAPYNFAASSSASSLNAIAAADLNRDGQTDVVTVESNSRTPVAVMISKGNGQFNSPVRYALAPNPMCSPCGGPQAVAIADFNNDGKPDVITAQAGVSNGEGPGLVNVLLGNGDGTLRPAILTNLPSGSPVGGYPSQLLALGDFNHDGKLDAAVAAYGSAADGSGPGSVLLLFGNGDGTFLAPVTLAMPDSLHPVALAAADLNGDGILDLAVELVDRDFSGNPVTLAIFLGQANGAFGAARTFTLQSKAGAAGNIAIGDLNRDGKPDIAVSSNNAGSRLIDIVLGDGAGGFQEVASIPQTINSPQAMVMADLNGDAKPDLVIADGEGAYLLGNGDGTFQFEQHFVSGAPVGLALTSFTSGALPDLAVADNSAWLALSNNFFPAAPAPPSPASGSGTGTGQPFTFTFSDSAGYGALTVVDILINSALDGRHACYIAFAPTSATSGSVYLVDDSGDAGGPFQGLVLPGGGSISNSQCTITGAGSSVSAGGSGLTLTLAISFSAAFSGNKIFYTSAQDIFSNNSGWQALGTWTVPGVQASGPSVGGMSPARTISPGPPTYSFTFTDTNGWQDIAVANILINSAIDGRHACYMAYVPSSGALFLVDNPGDAGGPFAGGFNLPGSGSANNSQCTVGGAGASVNGNGNTLTLALPITFTSSFAGNQIIFLAARSNTANSNWQAVGTVSVP